jgi:hypothetical protein
MKIKKLVFCLIIVLSSFVILIAQDTDKTRLNGHIMDTTGASAPGIKIKIQDKVGKTFETLTDAEGFYSIKLPTGNYLIEIVSSGGLFGIKVENYKTAPTKMTLVRRSSFSAHKTLATPYIFEFQLLFKLQRAFVA